MAAGSPVLGLRPIRGVLAPHLEDRRSPKASPVLRAREPGRPASRTRSTSFAAILPCEGRLPHARTRIGPARVTVWPFILVPLLRCRRCSCLLIVLLGQRLKPSFGSAMKRSEAHHTGAPCSSPLHSLHQEQIAGLDAPAADRSAASSAPGEWRLEARTNRQLWHDLWQ